MTLNCKGKLIDISTPKVMGILNITPDSFFDGGKHLAVIDALSQTEKMLTEGATFIDVGAYSSRPGAKHISEADELERILPIIKTVVKKFPDVLLSIDTFRSTIAKACIEAGAAIINDISAGVMDNNMLPTVAKLQVPYIMMHMQGTPQNMQSNPAYNNVITDVKFYFSEKVTQARALGINDIILDPGFGFGKTIEHNYQMLQGLDIFKTLNLPILAGISRKSMIYKHLNTTPQDALNATTALNMVALQKGASILRVHDVKEAVECVNLYNTLENVNHA